MKHEIDDVTNCCGKSFIGETDVCRKCEEHADVMEKEDENI